MCYGKICVEFHRWESIICVFMGVLDGFGFYSIRCSLYG